MSIFSNFGWTRFELNAPFLAATKLKKTIICSFRAEYFSDVYDFLNWINNQVSITIFPNPMCPDLEVELEGINLTICW